MNKVVTVILCTTMHLSIFTGLCYSQNVPLQQKPIANSRVSSRNIESMVFVKTKQGVGSGFHVTIGNENFVVSNAHVVENAAAIVLTDIKGAVLKIKTVEFSDKSDMVRFRVEETSMKPLTIRTSMPAIGEQVYVCGNSSGANVVTEIYGKVVGVGPSEIEVDAKFVPGNSGSPMLDENNEVIGVATYATREKPTWITENTRFSDVRRFGLRMTVDDWVNVTPKQISDCLYLQTDVWTALNDIAILTLRKNGYVFDGYVRPQFTELFWKYTKESERSKFITYKTWGDKIALFCDDYFNLLKQAEKINIHSLSARGAKASKSSFSAKDFEIKKANVDKNLLLVCDEAIDALKKKGYTSFANNSNKELIEVINIIKNEIGDRKTRWFQRPMSTVYPDRRLEGWQDPKWKLY